MFQVIGRADGRVFTVYAISGTRFLIWNDDTQDEHWEWVEMDHYRPVTVEDQADW